MNNQRHEMKPTNRMKRKTSIKKVEVAGDSFSLRWDSLCYRSNSNQQTHGDAGDPRSLYGKM